MKTIITTALFLGLTWAGVSDGAQEMASQKNILFVGSSYIASAGSQRELVGALLKSKEIPADCDQHTGAGMGCVCAWFHNLGKMTADEMKRKDSGKLDDRMAKEVEGRTGKFTAKLKSRPRWDFVVIDTYGSPAAPDFPEAVAGFVKDIRAHSPNCNIILYSVWPGKKGTKEQAQEIFQRCIEQAKQHSIWVATTGPALFEASVERPDLKLHRSDTDGHPGMHGGYINACSLFALLTGQSPVGLPSKFTVGATYDFPPKSQAERPKQGEKVDYSLSESDARFLQEVAWKVYQREIRNTKPHE